MSDYRQQLESELLQAKAWKERLTQYANDGDVAFIDSFMQRAAVIGETAAAKELLGALP